MRTRAEIEDIVEFIGSTSDDADIGLILVVVELLLDIRDILGPSMLVIEDGDDSDEWRVWAAKMAQEYEATLVPAEETQGDE